MNCYNQFLIYAAKDDYKSGYFYDIRDGPVDSIRPVELSGVERTWSCSASTCIQLVVNHTQDNDSNEANDWRTKQDT